MEMLNYERAVTVNFENNEGVQLAVGPFKSQFELILSKFVKKATKL